MSDTATTLDATYDAGDFKPGDKVTVTNPTLPIAGMIGVVTRIDTPEAFGYNPVFPVIINTKGYKNLPVCASDIQRVAK